MWSSKEGELIWMYILNNVHLRNFNKIDTPNHITTDKICEMDNTLKHLLFPWPYFRDAINHDLFTRRYFRDMQFLLL